MAATLEARPEAHGADTRGGDRPEIAGRPGSASSSPPGSTGPARSSERGLGRPYWQLWGAASVSSLGDGLAVVALPLLAAGLTRSPALVAGVVVAQRLPWLLLSLPAGALADRLHRGRLMASVDVARAAILVGVALAVSADVLTITALYLAAFGLGALECAFSAAAHAAVPALVADNALDRANGYLFASQASGEQLAGPAIGGLLFAAGAAIPFALDGASFLVSALLLLGVARRLPRPARTAQTSLAGDIGEGVRFFARDRLLRALAVLVGGLAFCQAAVMGVLVLFALEVLDLGHVGYGVFLGAAAVGNVAGAVAAPRLKARLGATAVLVGAALAAGAVYLLMAGTRSAVAATALMAVEAFAVAAGSVVSITLRQAAVPDELRGRVGNVFRMCIWGVIPLGALAGGLAAGVFGLRAPFLMAGGAQLLLVTVTAGRLRAAVARPVIDLRPVAAPAVS